MLLSALVESATLPCAPVPCLTPVIPLHIYSVCLVCCHSLPLKPPTECIRHLSSAAALSVLPPFPWLRLNAKVLTNPTLTLAPTPPLDILRPNPDPLYQCYFGSSRFSRWCGSCGGGGTRVVAASLASVLSAPAVFVSMTLDQALLKGKVGWCSESASAGAAGRPQRRRHWRQYASPALSRSLWMNAVHPLSCPLLKRALHVSRARSPAAPAPALLWFAYPSF